MNQFFAIRRGGSNHNSARVNDRGVAAEPKFIIFPDAVRCNDVALVFDRTRLREHPKVFLARKRPGRRNKENAYVLLGGELSIHLGKSEVIADAKAKF